jgi:hypothetical protein
MIYKHNLNDPKLINLKMISSEILKLASTGNKMLLSETRAVAAIYGTQNLINR